MKIRNSHEAKCAAIVAGMLITGVAFAGNAAPVSQDLSISPRVAAPLADSVSSFSYAVALEQQPCDDHCETQDVDIDIGYRSTPISLAGKFTV